MGSSEGLAAILAAASDQAASGQAGEASPRAVACVEEAKKGRAAPPPPTAPLACARCGSDDTKFCYYNNYNIKQPRFYCKVRAARARKRARNGAGPRRCLFPAAGRASAGAPRPRCLFGRCVGPARGGTAARPERARAPSVGGWAFAFMARPAAGARARVPAPRPPHTLRMRAAWRACTQVRPRRAASGAEKSQDTRGRWNCLHSHN